MARAEAQLAATVGRQIFTRNGPRDLRQTSLENARKTHEPVLIERDTAVWTDQTAGKWLLHLPRRLVAMWLK